MNEGIFKAMSDPTRRKIIELLKDGPKTAGEIASHFSHAQPTISRHLNVLKNAHVVVDQREGTFIIYRLNTTVLQDWLAWLMKHFGGENNDEKE
ncbi:autorepressor SdpR family transcription factor [Alicyclobacillus shizuokensis]|uniref:autorepressor SdpR family transcription factor n=1 Tax=Alicyclobacillus shizuokensis TaxID=392014 RepID=UPI00082CC8BD|nr:autorepressor SdpR family transcription factor [Alicyclobacillus shizuokensis]MCL6625089.1 autorepressor SdpR family transcription factor [Alicyclobacillus shizuokensis]